VAAQEVLWVNRNDCEFQADRIEAVLMVHKVAARVTGGTVTPRWVEFQVLPAVGAKISKIKGLSEEMAAALNAPSVRISRRGAAVAVEVPRDDPRPVRLLPLLRQVSKPPPVTAILGLAQDGAPLLIRLPSPDVAHVLVAGTTGSGKTALLQAMILSLVLRHSSPRELTLCLVDPKGRAFGLFAGLPHLARPVCGMDEAPELLRSLVHLMVQRDARRESSPVVVVIIDELADLLIVGGKSVQTALTRLTQRGREAGIHVVAATQKPTAAVLGPLVKANFPVRIVGRVTSIEDARTATGWGGTGAERLMGRGDFVAVAEGRVIRFQGAHVSEGEIRDVLARRGWEPPEPEPVEAEPVEAEMILPTMPPEEEVDRVGELVSRLEAMEWDPTLPYLQACRALGESPGGGPFLKVRAAVERMRANGTTTDEKSAEGNFSGSGCICHW
jgi:S-DNA-T family DNA segregation ATPase FtsK/SpoIIIE